MRNTHGNILNELSTLPCQPILLTFLASHRVVSRDQKGSALLETFPPYKEFFCAIRVFSVQGIELRVGLWAGH